MPTKNKCPHCNKVNCFKEVAFHNAEAYGSNSFKMVCVKCEKPIVVYLSRVVVVAEIAKGHHKCDELDFPGN